MIYPLANHKCVLFIFDKMYREPRGYLRPFLPKFVNSSSEVWASRSPPIRASWDCNPADFKPDERLQTVIAIDCGPRPLTTAREPQAIPTIYNSRASRQPQA